MRPSALSFPLIVLLICGALVAGCGTQESNLIPSKRAHQLTATVQAIANASDSARCSSAELQLQQAKAQVEALPSSVDKRLVSNLRDWLNHIGSRLSIDCKEATAKPEAAPNEKTPAEEEVVPPKEKEPKPPSDDPEETGGAPATPPETPTQPEPTSPGGTGGAEAETPPPTTPTPG